VTHKLEFPIISLLDGFAKQIETSSLITFVGPSVGMEQRDPHRMDFREISYLVFSLKICDHIPTSVKMGKEVTDILHEDLSTFV
jgi:hypothetical protein